MRRFHGRPAPEMPGDTTLLSVRMSFSGPFARTDVEESVRRIFHALSPAIMTEGILLGHLKAGIQTENGVYAASMTREEEIDETADTSWNQSEIVPSYVLTINLLSIRPLALDKRDLESILQKHCPRPV